MESALILRFIDSLRIVEMLRIRRSQSSISHQGEGTRKKDMLLKIVLSVSECHCFAFFSGHLIRVRSNSYAA